MPLPWMKSSLLDDVDSWSFTNTANSAMAGLADMGSRLMAPVGQQVRQVAERALPPPPPAPVAQPVAPREVVPSVPTFSLGKVEDWITPTQPRRPVAMPEVAPPPSAGAPAARSIRSAAGTSAAPTSSDASITSDAGGFSLPPLEAFIPSLAPKPAAGASSAPSPAPSAAGAAPGAPTDIEGYIRRAALSRGIDPDTAIKVVNAEGGTSDPVRQSDVVYQGQREQSYGPLQLNVAGGVGAAALKAGIDPRDPAQWQRAVDFGLDEVARSGWGQWHGAARVGVGPREGIGGPRAQVAPAPPAAAARQPTPGPGWGTYTPESLTPNQIDEGRAQGLSSQQALAICGPAAAVAFARANGRNPTLSEAKDLAEASGVWDVSAGMHGPASEVALLEKMGIPAQLEQGADWGRIAQEVGAGRPVIVDTPGHYFTVNGAYPDGTFELGQSAGVLKASGGRTRYRPEEIPGLGMGAPRASIYVRR